MASNTTKKAPAAIALGTAGWNTTPASISMQNKMISIMRQHGITRIDTARRYGAGFSETAIGNQNIASEFSITTKALSGSNSKEGILKAARESFKALGVEKVHIYLLHSPDESVTVEETYSAIQELYLAGHFDKFGLSNFTPTQVHTFHTHAKTHNLILPTIYQSSYSAATRLNETLLFPTLRELGMSIQAYSPLASGFLSKSPAAFEARDQAGENGGGRKGREGGLSARWDPNTLGGQTQRLLFQKPEYIDMLSSWSALSKESGVSQIGLAYRWVAYHSFLDGSKGDEMILGASSADQFEEAVKEIEKGALEEWVVERIEGLWDGVKGVAEVDFLRAWSEVVNRGGG